MGHYSISELEQLSGIKAHTIRIWEQRYGLLRPVRTATNIRTYCDGDLRRLLNVATLCSRGYRISKIAQLNEQEICQAVGSCYDDEPNYCQQINEVITAMLELDATRINQLLQQNIEQLGFETAMMDVVYPLLQRIGVMWQTGSANPAQEHLVACLVRQKMLAAIDGLEPMQTGEEQRWVLFLPAGELHELALLFMSYVLRVRGQHVLYLGQNLPVSELQAVCATYRPYALCTVLTTEPERDRVEDFVQDLTQRCPDARLFVYGPLVQNADLQLPPRTVRLRQMPDFVALVDELQPALMVN